MRERTHEAEALKIEGNNFFKDKKWADAAKKYRKAIGIDPECAVYWSNLAMCSQKLNQFLEWKDAAHKCLEIDPSLRLTHHMKRHTTI